MVGKRNHRNGCESTYDLAQRIVTELVSIATINTSSGNWVVHAHHMPPFSVVDHWTHHELHSFPLKDAYNFVNNEWKVRPEPLIQVHEAHQFVMSADLMGFRIGFSS